MQLGKRILAEPLILGNVFIKIFDFKFLKVLKCYVVWKNEKNHDIEDAFKLVCVFNSRKNGRKEIHLILNYHKSDFFFFKYASTWQNFESK